MEKFIIGDQSSTSISPEGSIAQTTYTKYEELQEDSEMIDSSAVAGMERLILSDPTQKMEDFSNINWQHLEMLVTTL
jgi:hypothetical protein